MPSALIFIADGTEEMELLDDSTITYDTLVRAGIETQSVFVPEPKDSISAGLDKFDVLVIPGGAKGAETISQDSQVQALVRAYLAQNKLVGMICAGSLAALTSNLPKQPLTSHPGVKSELVEKSIEFNYSEDSVVVSGNLITTRGPGTTFPFALTLVERLCGKEKRAEVHGPMVFPAGTPW
ncbi:hypothetical protein V5O48_003006 [Marasmius crinis-equi]|uniref:D-lactate dehydratase n=1 Tax=Marasmius crinis-equi TaxID=585013 RepID=A0ABR3FU22_9AGAR